MYPYRQGDNWSARQSNFVFEHARDNSGAPLPRKSDARDVKATTTVELGPYSVFGLGNDAGNVFIDPLLEVKVSDPVGESIAPYFTNGAEVFEVAKPAFVDPITARPMLLKIAESIVPGDRAKPNDTGQAEKSDSGELLCVSDPDPTTTYNWFVFSGIYILCL